MSNVKAGDRCVAVVNVGTVKRWPYVGPQVYEAQPRKADGVLTWRCVERAPRARWFRSVEKAEAAAEAMADAMGVPSVFNVRHGRVAR